MNQLSDQPTPAELLADAAGYHLAEAQTDAREAGRHLTTIAGQDGLTAPQRRRLGQLAATAELIAAGAGLLLGELA
jgi:hypothetical protein